MYKADVLAAEASKMNPDVSTQSFTCPIQELGDGFLLEFDLIVAGLDNREARVWLGAAAKRTGKIWIDGAIEGLMGKVQTFVPDGPCYACTMGDKDWEALTKRLSCKLLGVEEMEGGHTPTNATTSSIIAGIQAQEAIKYLVGKKDYFAFENKVWRMMGEQMSTFFSIIEISEECPFHFDEIPVTSESSLPDNLGELWRIFNQPSDAVLGFYDDFIEISACHTCGGSPKLGYKDVMKRQGKCNNCDQELSVELFSRIQLSDHQATLPITDEYWPMKTLVEFSINGIPARYQLNRRES
jgi:adenylyltransferase/sulfurtransferase